ncbi:Short-chain dehydrogenase/reductase family protein [Mycena kentingensis (nom. inval.)]|nr:Short-chain dehydrogenase/reductase family protein [Mycena kentingensis (nom. inval.)]
MQLNFTRRSFFVSGANQGIGMHTVHQIALNPGVVVFMGSRRLEAAEAAIASFDPPIHASSSVVPVQLDVTDEASVRAAAKLVQTTLEQRNIAGLDVLINNAGVLFGTLAAVYAVNFSGAVSLTDALRPFINRGGVIINISSTMGSIGTLLADDVWAILVPYNTSKSAMNALTVNWAIKERREGTGVRVVSICPGSVKTSTNPQGERHPADACRIIVKTAMESEGRTGVFFDKDGDIPW